MLHKPQPYFKIFPTGGKKKPPSQNEDCEALCLKFQLLGWMTQQQNPDTGLFILWAYLSYHLLGTTCQFVNTKDLKLVKICGLLPAWMRLTVGRTENCVVLPVFVWHAYPWTQTELDRYNAVAANLPCALFSCTSVLERQNIVFPPEKVYPKTALKK